MKKEQVNKLEATVESLHCTPTESELSSRFYAKPPIGCCIGPGYMPGGGMGMGWAPIGNPAIMGSPYMIGIGAISGIICGGGAWEGLRGSSSAVSGSSSSS